jgi:uncharacterized protein (DUF2235 family)
VGSQWPQRRQRLVICLDGTWNQRDSGTNICKLSDLVQEGEVGSITEPFTQRVYYDEGVGTGLLDGITGGAFGFGLSRNVREAYDWLVEYYCDDDEIYVFGFSRGAFTARSLVGLIARCGLLRRGAPISTEELWNGYQILGRHLNEHTGSEPPKNWWERIRGKPKRPFRELRELQNDPWDRDPHPPKRPANRTEALLCRWSRRVRIKCLGVFDTVGSMGLDSLAIPWLRDRIAQFHNTQLSSLVMNGFQALAIDEHRADFIHIPWHQLVHQAGTGTPDSDSRIEQRWFVGAHSNVGGGYADDVLAQYSLAWLVSECKELGLIFKPHEQDLRVDPSELRSLTQSEKSSSGLSSKPPQIRDSYSEFANGFWKHFIRSKREYRRIDPPPELQNGKLMRSVNECLDSSVDLIKAMAEKRGETYSPPNLWEFCSRVGRPHTGDAPRHHYLDGIWAAFWLVVWLAGISVAGWMFDRWLSGSRSHVFVFVIPLVALIADYIESALNHKVALHPDGMKAEACVALMDFCLGLRLIAIICFITGVCVFAGNLLLWILTSFRSPNVLWLVMLDLLVVGLIVSKSWCVAPMMQAGFGSIAPLQEQTTPRGVREYLKYWAGGDSSTSSHALLVPVVRTVWRDIFSFIPAYSILLFIGSWTTFSLAAPSTLGHFHSHRIFGPLESDSRCWIAAAIITIVCSLANVIKDSCHLNFISRYPDLPSHFNVVLSRAATLTGLIFFVPDIVVTVSGALWLLCVQNRHILHFKIDPGSILAVFAGAVILCFSPTPVVRRLGEFSLALCRRSLATVRRGLTHLASAPNRIIFKKPE